MSESSVCLRNAFLDWKNCFITTVFILNSATFTVLQYSIINITYYFVVARTDYPVDLQDLTRT